MGAPRLCRLSWLFRPGYAFATAAVVSPRLADGCFTPASRSRPGHPPRYSFSTASAHLRPGSDRPALAVDVIGMRGMESRDGRLPHSSLSHLPTAGLRPGDEATT